MTLISMLSDDNLTRLAGLGAFQRGKRYFDEGRVTVRESDDSHLRAGVSGSADYAVELLLQDGELSAACDCPVEGFCKHAVAAALAWRGEVPVKPKVRKDAPPDLAAFLKAQPVERLAQLLGKYAHEYDGIRRELILLAKVESSRDDPAALGKAVRAFLSVRRFLDYRDSITYGRELDGLVSLLRQTLSRDAALCATLCEAAAAKLFRIYENSDDSAGAIGSRFHDLAELHRQACAMAPPPPKELAKRLHALAAEDGWELFDFTHYLEALGADGLAAFGALLHKEWEGHYGQRWQVRHLLEKWAQQVGDYELLIALRSSDLSKPYDYVGLVETYRQAGRQREALAAAERGMKAFPRDWTMRELAARELHAAGMDDEALALLWRNFEEQPSEHAYQTLLEAAGNQRESWRERALQALHVREQASAKGGKTNATLRIEILLGENRVAEAVALAADQGCAPDLLERLAGKAEKLDPGAAAGFYRRVVEFSMENNSGNSAYARAAENLRCMRPLLGPAEFAVYLADLRQRFRAKRNFIKLLDEMAS